MRRMWNGIKKNVYKVTAYSSGIAAEWKTEDIKEAFEFYKLYCEVYSNYKFRNYTITIHKNGKLMKSTNI